MVEFFGGGSSLRAALHLPASKTDQHAAGLSRSLSCCCPVRPSGKDRASCPVHCLVDHLLYLQHLFPARWREGVAAEDLPLFPTAPGTVVSKTVMQDTKRQKYEFYCF